MKEESIKDEIGQKMTAHFAKQYFDEKKTKLKERDFKQIRMRVFNAIYGGFCEIKTILGNDTLDDFKCVEAIVKVYEKIGLDCGDRHDFG